MNIFNLFYLFVFLRINNKRKLYLFDKQNKQHLIKKQSKNGYDQRFNFTSDLDSDLLRKISLNLQKKQQLNILQDNMTDINTKLNMIKNYNLLNYESNNFTKNLGLKDFYFNFDKP
jgi:hypothetical protein